MSGCFLKEEIALQDEKYVVGLLFHKLLLVMRLVYKMKSLVFSNDRSLYQEKVSKGFFVANNITDSNIFPPSTPHPRFETSSKLLMCKEASSYRSLLP